MLGGFMWNYHCTQQINWLDFGIDQIERSYNENTEIVFPAVHKKKLFTHSCSGIPILWHYTSISMNVASGPSAVHLYERDYCWCNVSRLSCWMFVGFIRIYNSNQEMNWFDFGIDPNIVRITARSKFWNRFSTMAFSLFEVHFEENMQVSNKQ